MRRRRGRLCTGCRRLPDGARLHAAGQAEEGALRRPGRAEPHVTHPLACRVPHAHVQLTCVPTACHTCRYRLSHLLPLRTHAVVRSCRVRLHLAARLQPAQPPAACSRRHRRAHHGVVCSGGPVRRLQGRARGAGRQAAARRLGEHHVRQGARHQREACPGEAALGLRPEARRPHLLVRAQRWHCARAAQRVRGLQGPSLAAHAAMRRAMSPRRGR